MIYIIDSRGSCEDYSNIPLETLGIKQVTYHLFIRLDVLSFFLMFYLFYLFIRLRLRVLVLS